MESPTFKTKPCAWQLSKTEESISITMYTVCMDTPRQSQHLCKSSNFISIMKNAFIMPKKPILPFCVYFSGMQRATGKRSLVLSRSTFPGSGTMAGKWLGDNASIWIHMYRSIVGTSLSNFLNHNINVHGTPIQLASTNIHQPPNV